MNLSIPVFRTGLQRYALFLNFQIFLQKFLKLFFLRQSFVELSAFLAARFSNGSAKVRIKIKLPNFYLLFVRLFWKEKSSQMCN